MENRGLNYLCLGFLLSGMIGCAAAELASGEPGADVERIQVGITREDAEAVLGAPERCWFNDRSVQYCLFQYDAGRPPRMDDAFAMLFMDVVSLGLWELFHEIDPMVDEDYARIQDGIILSFDEAGQVTGKYEEFAKLPEQPEASTDMD